MSRCSGGNPSSKCQVLGSGPRLRSALSVDGIQSALQACPSEAGVPAGRGVSGRDENFAPPFSGSRQVAQTQRVWGHEQLQEECLTA